MAFGSNRMLRLPPKGVPRIIAPPRSVEESGEAVLKHRLPPAEDGLVYGEALSLAILRQVVSLGHTKLEERSPMPPLGAAGLRAVEGYPSRLK